MKTDFFYLIPSALTIVYTIYGSWFLISEIFTTLMPLTLIFTGTIVCIAFIFRIPPPARAAVEAVLGKDIEDPVGDNNGFVIKTIAHRGAGLDAPENTIEAFKKCHEKGCDIIELDVCLSADQVPIVFHDSDLERMADLNVLIKNMKYEDLTNIDISVKHAYRDSFPNAHIPTLEQAVQQMLGMGQRIFIDIKEHNTKVQLYKTGGGNYLKTATALDELIVSSNPMRFQGLVNPADELEIGVDNSFSPELYSTSLSAASGSYEPSVSSAPVLVIASTSWATPSDLEELVHEEEVVHEEEAVYEEEEVPGAIPVQEPHKKIQKKTKRKLEEEALEIIASKEKVYLNIANVLLEKHKVDLERAKEDLTLKRKQVEETNLSIENKKLEQQLLLKQLEKKI